MQALRDENSASEALDRAPLGIMLVRDGRVVRANASLAEWLGELPVPLHGLDRETAEPLGLAVLFEDVDRLGLVHAGGEIRLRRRRAVLADGTEAHYFEDITEFARLERERDYFQALARSLDAKDLETGLPNRNSILQTLDEQVSRSRRYGNPLSMIRLVLHPPAVPGSLTLKTIAQELNAGLRWADYIGRLDSEVLLLILPETPLADAESLAAKLGHDRVAVAKSEGWEVRCTVAAWEGDDTGRLLKRLETEPPIA